MDWWRFLQEINACIGEVTNSEDKKLGYYFVNAGAENVKLFRYGVAFRSKVIFYLWNDVYKDYGFDDDIF